MSPQSYRMIGMVRIRRSVTIIGPISPGAASTSTRWLSALM